MQVLNRFSPLRFGGQNASQPINAGSSEDYDYSEISLPNDRVAHRLLMDSLQRMNLEDATDCFDGSSQSGQIQLPLAQAAQSQLMDTLELSKKHKNSKMQQHQQAAIHRMHEDLNKKVAQQEKAYTKQLREMALLAFKHSLLTEQNNMLLYGTVKNDNWDKEYGKLKHPPEQARGLDLEPLLHTEASTLDTLGFDFKVHNLYTSTMGHFADRKPAGLKLKPMSAKECIIYHRNETTQEKLEQEMETFRHETLRPLQKELEKTRTEAAYFQTLLVPQGRQSEQSEPKPLSVQAEEADHEE